MSVVFFLSVITPADVAPPGDAPVPGVRVIPSPNTYTLKLLIAVTMMLTTGAFTYFERSCSSLTFSSWGVTPVACTSPRSGTEILPSGLTGTVTLNSWFPHTEICSTSSSPITYPPAIAVRHIMKIRKIAPMQMAPVLITPPSYSAITVKGHDTHLNIRYVGRGVQRNRSGETRG